MENFTLANVFRAWREHNDYATEGELHANVGVTTETLAEQFLNEHPYLNDAVELRHLAALYYEYET